MPLRETAFQADTFLALAAAGFLAAFFYDLAGPSLRSGSFCRGPLRELCPNGFGGGIRHYGILTDIRSAPANAELNDFIAGYFKFFG